MFCFQDIYFTVIISCLSYLVLLVKQNREIAAYQMCTAYVLLCKFMSKHRVTMLLEKS